MRLREVAQFVDGTLDPAFAIDGLGNIVAWNNAAVETLEIQRDAALDKPCHEVICGTDERGAICSSECIVMRSVKDRRPAGGFDLRVKTPRGEEWFYVSLIIVDVSSAKKPYAVHIMRPIDLYKRLEIMLRDFVLNKTDIPPEQVDAVLASDSSAVRWASLTTREVEILRLVERGESSKAIAESLRISPSTVANHMQHILKKLGAHSKLEAVLRAERSGLL
jgi:DNA-binding CsgD family transcriptional regulator